MKKKCLCFLSLLTCCIMYENNHANAMLCNVNKGWKPINVFLDKVINPHFYSNYGRSAKRDEPLSNDISPLIFDTTHLSNGKNLASEYIRTNKNRNGLKFVRGSLNYSGIVTEKNGTGIEGMNFLSRDVTVKGGKGGKATAYIIERNSVITSTSGDVDVSPGPQLSPRSALNSSNDSDNQNQSPLLQVLHNLEQLENEIRSRSLEID